MPPTHSTATSFAAARLAALAAVCLALLLPARASGDDPQSAAAEAEGRLLIRAEWLFSGEGDEAVQGMDVLCCGDRIEAVGPGLEAPEGTAVLKAEGACVLPGLIDVHARLYDGFEISPVYLFPAFGVTAVRDLDNLLLRVKGLEELTSSGEILGPRIFYGGESLTSLGPVGPFQKLVEGPDPARAAVRELAQGGADFVVLSSAISKEAAAAAAEEAAALGLPVVADFLDSRSLDAFDALHLGARSLERLGGVPQALRRRDAPPPPEGRSPLFDWLDMDPAREETLLKELAAAGMYLVPTLTAFESLARAPDESSDWGKSHPWIPASMLRYWEETETEFRSFPWWPAACQLHLDYSKAFLQKAVAAGVPIAAGSGTPTPGVGPGEGLLREIELLAAAGLTPAQALCAATSGAARCLGRERELGVLAPGRAANLLVVEGNPLEDLGALHRIQWVILRGRIVDRQAIPGFNTK